MDLFGVQASPGPFLTLIFCLGFFGFFALFHLKWLRFPLLLIVFLLLSSLVLLFDGVMKKFYVATADFILWMTPFIASGEFSDSKYGFFFFLLLLAVFGLFCHISISVIRSPFPLLVLTTASAISIPFLFPESKPNLLWLLPCIIGGTLALSLTAKAENEQGKVHMNPDRSFLISMTAVLVTLVFIFFTAGIAMSDVPEKGLQSNSVVIRLNQLSRQIVSFFTGDHKKTAPASLYDSSEFGMRGEHLTLGGVPNLSDEIVLEVTSDRDLLLKGRTYDEYSSTKWGSDNSPILMDFDLPGNTFYLFENSSEPIQFYPSGEFIMTFEGNTENIYTNQAGVDLSGNTFYPPANSSSEYNVWFDSNSGEVYTFQYDASIQNPYPDSVLISLFDTFRPAPDRIPPYLGGFLFVQCDITVKNASKLVGSSLFYPDHLVDADFSEPLFFDEDASLFSKKALAIGAEYKIRANVFRSGDQAFRDNLLTLEAYINETPEASDDFTHRDSIAQDYLDVDVPDSVIETSLMVTADCTTPLEKAFAIQDYLRSNFSYSLQVPEIPKGRDFVEFFLESKVGYCTYFASAMCMMSRANGIPARFVEGFYVDVPNSELGETSTVIVTGKSAHAWCEIYINGIGWIPIDATPGGDGNPSEITPTPTPEVPGLTPGVTPVALPATPTSTPIPSETKPSVSPTKGAINDWNGEGLITGIFRFLATVLIVIVVLLATAAVFFWPAWRNRKYFSIPTREALQAIGGNERQLRFLWSRCLHHLRLADIRIMSLETPLDFARRLENVRVTGRGCSPGVYRFNLGETASVYEQMIYGLKTPSAEDIEEVRKNCILLSGYIRSVHFSAVHYTINRLFKRMKRR
jgi:transglutaminase-like putative cysteine protease